MFMIFTKFNVLFKFPLHYYYLDIIMFWHFELCIIIALTLWMLQKACRNTFAVLLLYLFSVKYRKTTSIISSFVKSEKQLYFVIFSQNFLSPQLRILSIGSLKWLEKLHHNAMIVTSHWCHIELNSIFFIPRTNNNVIIIWFNTSSKMCYY